MKIKIVREDGFLLGTAEIPEGWGSILADRGVVQFSFNPEIKAPFDPQKVAAPAAPRTGMLSRSGIGGPFGERKYTLSGLNLMEFEALNDVFFAPSLCALQSACNATIEAVFEALEDVAAREREDDK